ncbi:hypothetical protein GCM10011519_15080 [Marmoricola endophyticus]|uniref:DUF899 domain-containing protein n=1 Tax=Marmoricola endophyticus TaxID=2040280 RepID=A0A917F4L7_9ACTN|nr:DUF899 family protein [Marmoricola endophyticus]GGF42218.1 hypothetical protein GCM10011519_15080 [Marmoricola endophyticus]
MRYSRVPEDATLPAVVERDERETRLEDLRGREKAHSREGDAIAAERRRLPMVEVDASLELVGPQGTTTLLEAFDGRRQLLAYFAMWHTGSPASEQCPGCTWCMAHLGELSYLHSRDITVAVLAQGPYDEGRRYRDFMGWSVPWYSALPSLDRLLVGRARGMMHLVSYVRCRDRVFETYWTTRRGVEVLDSSYRLMDLTVWGRQERHEDSPDGWPQGWHNVDGEHVLCHDGRPIAQWARVESGCDDSLTG